MAGKQIEVSIKRYLETLRTKNIKVKKSILYGSYFIILMLLEPMFGTILT